MIGEKIGRLAVLSAAVEHSHSSRRRWLCQCDCGQKWIAAETLLRTAKKRGKMASCGCARREQAGRFMHAMMEKSREAGRRQALITKARLAALSPRSAPDPEFEAALRAVAARAGVRV